MLNEKITSRVCEMRQLRSVTQEQLATAVGVTRQTIIAVERGNYTPSVLLALKIAVYFGQPVEKIFIITHENNNR